MTPLEKAARAASLADVEWSPEGRLGWGEMVARAVLMAVREPEALITESSKHHFAYPCWPADARKGFAAMIDAILADQPKGDE